MSKKRRGQGEGGIYQREDGRWCGSMNVGIINGKRKRKVVYGATRKEVADKLKALQRELDAGVNVVTERQTVKQFLENWLEQSIKPQRKAKTYHSYEQMVRLYLVPYLGRYQLTKLAPEHVQTMLNTLLEPSKADGKRLAPRTVQYVRAVLSQALNQALRWGKVARNVALVVDGPRVEKFKIAPLTEQQAQQLLEAVAGHRLEQLYRLTLSLGLRQGEVLGLRWEDVDFAKRTIRISGAIQQIGGTIQRVTPKTEASARTLPLTPLLLRSLKAHQAAQQQEKQECWAEWQEHDLVFPSEVGTPLAPRNLQRHFKGLLKKAGLPGRLRFHDLRHSCATFLIAQGVHPRVVMELLGHSQISVTMNTYAHVLPETQRDAAAKLDALLGGSGTSSKEQSKARAGEESEAGEADKQGGLNEQSDEESEEESDEDQRP
jgi:integrase